MRVGTRRNQTLPARPSRCVSHATPERFNLPKTCSAGCSSRGGDGLRSWPSDRDGNSTTPTRRERRRRSFVLRSRLLCRRKNETLVIHRTQYSTVCASAAGVQTADAEGVGGCAAPRRSLKDGRRPAPLSGVEWRGASGRASLGSGVFENQRPFVFILEFRESPLSSVGSGKARLSFVPSTCAFRPSARRPCAVGGIWRRACVASF